MFFPAEVQGNNEFDKLSSLGPMNNHMVTDTNKGPQLMLCSILDCPLSDLSDL
jgi:hypothetical protein